MIPLRLFIFTFATIPGLLIEAIESYAETNEKSGENTTINLTSDVLGQLNVSLSLDNMMLKDLPNGFVRSEFLTHLSLDGNQIESISFSAFEFIPRLLHLSLANNILQNIDLDQFSTLKNLKTLNLNGNCGRKQRLMAEELSTPPPTTEYPWGFDQVEPEYDERRIISDYVGPSRGIMPCEVNLSARLPSLSKLYLKDNNLIQLKFSQGFDLPLLTHLYISNNRLQIQSEMLSNLNELAPSLSDLHMENSKIDQFDASQLSALTSLYLDKNSIRCVCNEYCEPLSLKLKAARNLETLSISWNEIAKVEADSFNYTTNLVSLNLSYNQISEIREGTFEKLHQLRILHLESNHLVKINSFDTFKGLINLEYLSLGFNGIRNITVGAFETSVKLKTLMLNNNQISSIASGTFSKLTSLEELSLARNHLSRISDGCLPSSSSLITLNLNNNLFTSTEHIHLSNLPNLLFLSLKDNPLAAITSRWYSNMSENLTITLGKTCPGEYSTQYPNQRLWSFRWPE